MINPRSSDRVFFSLPEFTRFSWVNDRARDVWESRFQRVISAWFGIEWMSCWELRPCAMVILKRGQESTFLNLWAEKSLSAILLDEPSSTNDHNRPVSVGSRGSVVRCVVGPLQRLRSLQEAWQSGDVADVGELLGYPPCCCRAFKSICEASRTADPTWRIAMNSKQTDSTVSTVQITAPIMTNILWKSLGVRAISSPAV
jgi:hypothetical protein